MDNRHARAIQLAVQGIHTALYGVPVFRTARSTWKDQYAAASIHLFLGLFHDIPELDNISVAARHNVFVHARYLSGNRITCDFPFDHDRGIIKYELKENIFPCRLVPGGKKTGFIRNMFASVDDVVDPAYVSQ